jgi:hypothetical protein
MNFVTLSPRARNRSLFREGALRFLEAARRR